MLEPLEAPPKLIPEQLTLTAVLRPPLAVNFPSVDIPVESKVNLVPDACVKLIGCVVSVLAKKVSPLPVK